MISPRPLPFLAALALCSCQGSQGARSPQPAEAPAPPTSAPIEFSFESLDERPVSHLSTRGRATLVIFLTSYGGGILTSFGDPSLLQARYAKKVYKEHTPRINAAAVFLEPIENRPLVRLFRDAADLPFPSALADADTVAGRGPFKGIGTVPSVVVLDHEGREVFRKVGVASADELTRALRDAQRGVWGQDKPR